MNEDELTEPQRKKLDEVSRLTREANEHYRAGKFPDALPLYRKALALDEEVLGADHEALSGLLFNLGNLYYVQERYAEAEVS